MFFVLLIFFGHVFCQDSSLDEFKMGNHKFTADFYKELAKTSQTNFIASPLSAEIILALTQAGAEGNTAEEFTTALSLPGSQEDTQNAIKELLPKLNQTGDVKLYSANALFIQQNFTVKKDFKDIATNVYEAEVENINFSDKDKAAKIINDWVAEHTDNKIQNIINPKALNDGTKLVLANALYFKGNWTTPFRDSQKDKFFVSETKTVDVDMMLVDNKKFKYAENKEKCVKIVQLDYNDDKDNISMVVILPNNITGLSKVEPDLYSFIHEPQNLKDTVLQLQLPKFTTETSISMKPILQDLGLKQAFTQAANFSNISDMPLEIDSVNQKAFINVTKYGTEAAAATTVTVGTLSILEDQATFIANHPFLYYIQFNGIILFFGRVITM